MFSLRFSYWLIFNVEIHELEDLGKSCGVSIFAIIVIANMGNNQESNQKMSPIRQLLLKNQIKILMKNHHQKKKN